MPGLNFPPLALPGLRGSPLAPFNLLAHPGLPAGGHPRAGGDQDFPIPPERPLPLTGGGPLYSAKTPPVYLLDDEFTANLAAGSFLGTPANPGPGDRTGVDTNLIMSSAGGVLVVNGTPAVSDRFHLGSVARIAGQVFKISFPTVTTIATVGGVRMVWSPDGTTSAAGNPGLDYSGTTAVRIKDGNSPVYTTESLGPAPHSFALIMRASGGWSFALVSGQWLMLYIHPSVSTNPMFAKLIVPNATAVNFTMDSFRVPQQFYIPIPLAYDTFTRANGALDFSESPGPDGQTVMPRLWTGATYTISTNKAINTPNLGADVVVNGAFAADTDWNRGALWTIIAGVARATAASSDITATVAPLTLGVWYQTAFTIAAFTGGTVNVKLGTAVFPTHGSLATFTETGRATSTALALTAAAATLDVDNFSAKPLTLSELFASVQTGTQDIHARVAVTLDGALLGKQAGLVLNLDSASSPANFILAYLDGRGNAVLDECVAGTWTNKITAAITYSAGALLYIIRRGTSAWLFYNNAQVGTVQTMTANTNYQHGLFCTSPLCSLDSFEVWPDGASGNEHSALTVM